MLNWWLGAKPGVANDAKDNRDEIYEPPETPAPVFAARALKSAIFGTPKVDDDEEEEQEVKNEAAGRDTKTYENTKPIPISSIDMPRRGRSEPGNELRRGMAKEGTETKPSPVNVAPEQALSVSAPLSPTKLQGILLTPGTVTRRKTVSFGAGVVDNEGKNATGRSGLPHNFPGKFPSPWTPRGEVLPESSVRKTTLLKSLESARDGKKSNSVQKEKAKVEALNGESSSKGLQSDSYEKDNLNSKIRQLVEVQDAEDSIYQDDDGDYTIDINDPHSQSGKYWKSTFERYHEEAQEQMKRLVKYKQLAKSYAKKKDSEAIDLAEKLKEEQQKVVQMENRISELAAQMAVQRISGDAEESADLMKELATQTALAVQYRHEVDQFEEAMQERGMSQTARRGSDEQKAISPRTAQTLIETSIELKKAREQVKEISVLRAEMDAMRHNLSSAERKAARLKDENERLSRELAKAHADLDRSEKRRQSAEKLSQNKDAALQQLQVDYNQLKELAKSQRREAEKLLRQRHEQVSGLRKEVKGLRSQVVSSDSGQLRPSSSRTDSVMATKTDGTHKNGHLERDQENEARPINVASISNTSQKTLQEYPDQAVLNSTNNLLKSKQLRSSSSALNEMVNGAPVSRSASSFTGGKHSEVQDVPFNIPVEPMLPSFEVPLIEPANRVIQSKHPISSPRPSIINLYSSVRAQRWRQTRPHSAGTDAMVSSSRLSSLASSRRAGALPPERAAAAKARLERRMMEKRRAQVTARSDQKENIRAE